MRTKRTLPEQIKDTAKTPIEERVPKQIDPERLIPCGSTMLNLACSDRWQGAFCHGDIVNIIGDSHSGKTLLALSTFAEVAVLERFDEYDLIYNSPEGALEFDIPYLFGSKLDSRLQRGEEYNSDTFLDFHADVLDRLKAGKPFIYVLDSLDSLTTDEELEKIEKTIKAKRAGKKAAGSMGMQKAKGMSEMLRMLVREIEKSDSLLIIISQTRQNIDPMSFVKRRRAGGDALKFYCSHEIWLAHFKKIPKKDRVIGSEVKIKISKNKITGKLREVMFSTYYDYGIDDIGSCIDFMVKEGKWHKPKEGTTITAKDLNLKGPRATLIKQIEEQNLELQLHRYVGRAWNQIEDGLRLRRKSKYE